MEEGSNLEPILKLANLIEGTYNFTLCVTNNNSQKSCDMTQLRVHPGERALPHVLSVVHIHLCICVCMYVHIYIRMWCIEAFFKVCVYCVCALHTYVHTVLCEMCTTIFLCCTRIYRYVHTYTHVRTYVRFDTYVCSFTFSMPHPIVWYMCAYVWLQIPKTPVSCRSWWTCPSRASLPQCSTISRWPSNWS